MISGQNPLSAVGVNAQYPPNTIQQRRDPTPNDSMNVSLNDFWLNTVTTGLFVLTSLSEGIAVWASLNAGAADNFPTNSGTAIPVGGILNIFGSSGILTSGSGNTVTITPNGSMIAETLTSNTGGAVSPLLGNINIVGDGTTITGVGDPATHTITLSLVSTGAIETLTGNSGGAIAPTAGNINFVGTGSISVVGDAATHTLTITPSGSLPDEFVADIGTAIPIGGILHVNGSHGINTGGATNILVVAIDNAITLGDITPITGSPAITLTTGDLTISSGNINLTNTNHAGTSGQIRLGNLAFVTNYGTQNTFLGGASNTTLTIANAEDNVGIGYGALSALSGVSGVGCGNNNVAIGAFSLTSFTSAPITIIANNTAVGALSGVALTTGYNNLFLGSGAGSATVSTGLTTGNNNAIISLGMGAYTSSESNNILLVNAGVIGESNTLRIGTYGTGTQQINKSYIAATYNNYGTANTFVGEQTANLTFTVANAIGNVAVGYQALNALTGSVGLKTGSNNVAIGAQSLLNFTSSAAPNVVGSNTCVGTGSGGYLTTGSANTLIGNQSGTGSSFSVGITTGINNVILGNLDCAYTSSESNNILIENGGVNGESNHLRIGQYGVGAGQVAYTDIAACYSNYGVNNAFVGVGAGNTAFNTSFSQSCTAVGFNALMSLAGTNIANGSANTAVGAQSLTNFTASGSGGSSQGNNTAVGAFSGRQITTGINNTLIGVVAGCNANASAGITTGNNNIILYSAACAYTSSESNNILLGNPGINSESNALRIGVSGSGAGQQNATFIAGIRGTTTVNNNAVAVLIDSAGQLGTTSSSKRFKNNIKPMADLSTRIYDLEPKTFYFKSDPMKTLSVGLIAEEVHEVMPELVVYSDSESTKGLPETVRYHELPVLLLNEIKKLRARIEQLEAR
jgi:hypothetical protein